MAKFEYGLDIRQWMARQDAINGRKEAFWSRMNYRPFGFQRDVHFSPAKRRVLRCGRQMGKTVCAAEEIVEAMMGDRARVWIVGPEYKETTKLYDTAHDMLCSDAPIDPETMPDSRGLGIKPSRSVRNAPQMLVMPWGATLEIKTTKDVTTKKLAGQTLNRIAWDECAFSPETAWMRLAPTLAVRKGDIIFTSTPNGDNHFRQWWERGWPDDRPLPDGGLKDERAEKKDPMWESFYAETRDIVPEMPQMAEALDEYQRTMTEEWFDQEFRALFRSFVGQVYKEWSENDHVRSMEYDERLPLGMTFDFGDSPTNPFVCLWIQWTPEGELRIIREYKAYDRNIVDNGDEVVDITRREYGHGPRPMFFAADPAARGDIKVLKHHCKLRVQHRRHAKKHQRQIHWGIENIRVMLRGVEIGKDPDTGTPRYRPLLYVDPSCELVRHEFGSYQYPKQRADMVSKDVPLKVDDHSLDALRYFFAVWIGRFGIAPALIAEGLVKEPDLAQRKTLRKMLENIRNPDYGASEGWYA
jgi:hypothetical protein